MSSLDIPTFNFNEFENKLNNDEKKIILSFLDISSLCKVSCVSKSFSLSQLSNDDLFWKDHYKKFFKEFYVPTNLHYHFHYNIKTKEIKQEITTILQSTTQDYKNEITKFIKEIIENTQKIQKERLSKIEFSRDAILQNKETLLQKANTIMKNHKLKDCDCKVVTVGDGAIGKTSMLMTLSKNIPDIKNVDYIPTVMDNYNLTVSFNKKEKFIIAVWDTAGLTEYDRLRTLSYSSSDIILLYFSVVNNWSFTNIEETWIPEIQIYYPNVPIILCGTKIDLRENKKILFSLLRSNDCVPISTEEREALAKKIGAIAYIET
ncbi:hypothetical protein ABK040_003199 [Willaertia magna]